MSQNNDSEEVKHDSYMTSIFRPDCDTCERSKEDGETGCLDLGDGRELCSDCSSIAVTDLDECNYIIQSVFEFYKKEKLIVDEKIPIFFIDRIQMSKFSGDRKIFQKWRRDQKGFEVPNRTHNCNIVWESRYSNRSDLGS
uniref:protein DA1-related 1-like isoform X2 n=1 Tax=Fragaria vesca subsp. vesca TaxID=101020 RepID=UPI0005CB1C75|nr:PREDICTED: protein DA1-related 1-like isoform X2 [Fragaria vesca subsp. vesca]